MVISPQKRRVWKARLRRLASPWALPGWLLLAVRALDAAQRLDFVAGLLSGSRMLDWLQTWGWAAGLVWLAILVFVWPEKPDEKVRHVRNAQRLQRELFNLLIRIERLCKLYEIEDFNPSTYVYPLLDRREKLFEAAIADLVECVMDAVPQQHRAEYESFAVTGAISRLAQSQDENRSALDKEIPAGVGLELYLKRRSRKAVMPPAAPPPTKSVS